MAPTAVETNPVTTVESLKTQLASTPLVDLRAYPHFDNTPGIGTEFRSGGLQIADILSDQAKLAALARLVSERGVVFFREADITPDEQKTLVQALGEVGGKPPSSKLHVHPLTLPGQVEGDEISIVSNKFVFGDKFKQSDGDIRNRRRGRDQWHSDITFENVPSDYASLVIRTLPTVGGDTLWASAYDAYDRLSAPLQSFLESLKAEHSGENFLRLNAVYGGNPVREPRGAPENVGQDLLAVHPVIRTNPVTGWKGLFVNKAFTTRILELSKSESDALLEFLFDHVSANHDIQVRFRWEKNSLAIWDNRSTFHAATADLDGVLREGTRSVSLGERPFFDPQSRSRREDLEARAK
ncbi:hypothetical protein CcaverHIS002_0101580 [Cutaneotrichosporon cavernicola]|uniref:TauD/TfdA-like domain-containing protein n=1 Tax=Cutaneotrichosporon cavernicola TaxID=279322 RepID=A0AA48I758_9TREE|nr:uncharacterized protein CcaverHIS019_0101550 [Cutaneotrichosporon cavernicola]BEI79629.1 hypothetical protein CcaverHIS002_0101580 [Cutaneotrichosporon cavernicola]BEI87437.1 hypothetical protein CcaverHIS019_0101550 [Cutaneotrichosporon cavernicola]BEI95206.1 hypothetical protein CcaverHIS631_0101550 [Cutaneotrichosporon cavernicola]